MIITQFIDTIVNGAAGNFLCEIEELSVNALQKVFAIDTFGTFYATQQVFKQSMKQNKSGVIVNISATLHYRGEMVCCFISCLQTLTVGIAPGPIGDTQGMQNLGGFMMKSDALKKGIAKTIPLQ